MWTLEFWKDLGERAIKTFAQSLATGIVADATGLLDVEWITLLSVAGLITLASVLTSLASAPFSTKGTASLLAEVEYGA
jgi:hypothetical protein